MKITFLGATRTVTGSNVLIETKDKKFLEREVRKQILHGGKFKNIPGYEIIEEVKNLRGANVKVFGQPTTLPSDYGKYTIDIMPEFVTGRQLYNYIYKHFRKTISNPITV